MGTKALLVEDDDFTRLMLATSLASQGIQVVAQVSLASDALIAAKHHHPAVALLDLHLGKGPTGIDLAMELRRDQPEIGIVFLTSFEDPRLLSPNLPELPYRSVYLNKKSISEIKTLMDAIARSMDSSSLGGGTARRPMGDSPLAQLSDIQLETLRLMAQGLSNAEIAKRRFVTEKSVETAISRLAKTMGLIADPGKNQRVHMAKVYFRSLGINPEVED